MTEVKPFRIQKLEIKDFYSKEYLGLNTKELNRNSLFVFGTNNTGKSTTFDAIIYAIFGREFIDRPIDMASTKIVLSDGETTVEIERKYNAEPKMKIGKEEIKGSEQVNQKINEILKIPNNISNAKKLINALILPQKEEDTLLRKYSKNQLHYIITSFSSGTDTSERIEEIEREIEKLQSILERFEFEKRDSLKEIADLKLLDQRNKNYFDDIKEFIKQYESGEIKKTIDVLENNKEVEQVIGKLISKRTSRYDELFRTGSTLNNLRQYHDKELMEIIKQTLAVLICPVCGDNLDLNKVDGRKDKSMCPFCGKDHYTGDLYERLSQEISFSNKKLDEVLEHEKSLKEDLKNIDGEIDRLKKEKLGIEINPVIFRIIKETTEQSGLEQKYEENELLLAKYYKELESSKVEIEDLNKYLEQIGAQMGTNLENIKKLNEEKTHVIEDENRKRIHEFSEQLNEIFGRLVAPLTYRLTIQDGSIILNTGIIQKDCSDKHALGFSQKKLVDFALWATFHKINIKNNITNINFGPIDDLFENIDNNEYKWKDNLCLILKDLEKDIQLVVFSINKQMNTILQLPNEQGLQLQLNFGSFEE
ncbi:MAG: AAA family ATPase [Candidatus Methanoperedens sp.]|nr:AAA family ATPase [Candidatus Methanoperedens sp.]MCZ7403836.1 AAA family ATPase [Candidatus Methanoperedens sp.]